MTLKPDEWDFCDSCGAEILAPWEGGDKQCKACGGEFDPVPHDYFRNLEIPYHTWPK